MTGLEKTFPSQEIRKTAPGIGCGRVAIVLYRLWRSLNWIVLVSLLLLDSIYFLGESPAPVPIGSVTFVDPSWLVDTAYKLHQGLWLGRDSAFTYGALFQWMFGVSSSIHGLSLGSCLRTGHLLPNLCAILAIFVFAELLLGGHSPWKRAFYLICAVVFWNYPDVRMPAVLLLFAASLCELKRFTDGHGAQFRLAGLALALSVTFLISADTGAYSCLSFLAAAAGFAFCSTDRLRQRRLGRAVALMAIFLPVSMLLIGFLLVPWSLEFWRATVASLASYRWSMAGGMTPSTTARMAVMFASAAGILAIGWRWRNSQAKSLARTPAFFVSSTLLSFAFLQSGVVRSDWGHVAFALYPSFLLAGLVLMGSEEHEAGIRGVLPLFIALGITAAASGTAAVYVPQMLVANARTALQRSIHKPSNACSPGTFAYQGACLWQPDFDRISHVAGYLEAHTSPSQFIAIFPFENLYADMAGRPVAGGVLQAYAAAAPLLMERHIRGLEKQDPPVAVFSADEVATYGIDGVPNFTRSPELWLYLQARYTTETEAWPGVYILHRDRDRQQRWQMSFGNLPLTRNPQPLTWSQGVEWTIAENLQWPSSADFLRVRLRVSYPVSWHFLKPRPVIVRLHYSDGSDKAVLTVLPPDRETSLWIFPRQERQLAYYFLPNPGAWRWEKWAKAPVSLAIGFKRFDWASVRPKRAEILSLQAATVSLRGSLDNAAQMPGEGLRSK